jgi:transcriptional regulator with XRE-family HTH domain
MVSYPKGGMAMTLGERIRQERAQRSISQAELARRIGVSKNTMHMIEESKIADPRFSRVLAIARHLGMSLDDLVRGASPPTPDKPRGRKIRTAIA